MNKNKKATYSVKSKLLSNIVSLKAFSNLKSFKILVEA